MAILKKYMGARGAEEVLVSMYYIPHEELQDRSSVLRILLSKCDTTMDLTLTTVLHFTLVNRSSQALPTVAYFSSAFTE